MSTIYKQLEHLWTFFADYRIFFNFFNLEEGRLIIFVMYVQWEGKYLYCINFHSEQPFFSIASLSQCKFYGKPKGAKTKKLKMLQSTSVFSQFFGWELSFVWKAKSTENI